MADAAEAKARKAICKAQSDFERSQERHEQIKDVFGFTLQRKNLHGLDVVNPVNSYRRVTVSFNGCGRLIGDSGESRPREVDLIEKEGRRLRRFASILDSIKLNDDLGWRDAHS